MDLNNIYDDPKPNIILKEEVKDDKYDHYNYQRPDIMFNNNDASESNQYSSEKANNVSISRYNSVYILGSNISK